MLVPSILSLCMPLNRSAGHSGQFYLAWVCQDGYDGAVPAPS